MQTRVLTFPVFLISLLLLMTVFALRAPATEFLFDIGQDTMSLKGKGIPLSTILNSIERQTHIDVQAFPQMDEKVDADFSKIPIADGIALLMKNYNYSIGFEEGANGGEVVSSLFILSKTGSVRTSVVWREEERNTPQTAHATVGAQKNRRNSIVPAHMAGPPDESDPLKSLSALDPLARLEHDRQDHRLHGIFPDR